MNHPAFLPIYHFIFIIALNIRICKPFHFFVKCRILLLLQYFEMSFAQFIYFCLLQIAKIIKLVFDRFQNLHAIFDVGNKIILIPEKNGSFDDASPRKSRQQNEGND